MKTNEYKYNKDSFRVLKKNDKVSEELMAWELLRKREAIETLEDRIKALSNHRDILVLDCEDIQNTFGMNANWTDLQVAMKASKLKVQDLDVAISKHKILQDSEEYWRKTKRGTRVVFEVKSFNETRKNKIAESIKMQRQILDILDTGIGTWNDVKRDESKGNLHAARFRRNALMQLDVHRQNKEEYIVILESTELTSHDMPLFCAYKFDFKTNTFDRLKKSITANEYIEMSDIVRKGIIKKDNGELYIKTFSKIELTSLFNHIHDTYAK